MRSGFPSPLQVPGRENTRPRASPADAKPLRYIPGGTSSAVPGFSARARGLEEPVFQKRRHSNNLCVYP